MHRSFAVVLLVTVAGAQAAAPGKSPEQIYEQASQSVVVVHARDADGKPINMGSGVVTGREMVTTNCHVLEESSKIEVLYRGQVYAAAPGPLNQDRDLCQIRV